MVGAAAHGEPAEQPTLAALPALALGGAVLSRSALALARAPRHPRPGGWRGLGHGAGALADALADALAGTASCPGGAPPLVAQGAGLVEGGAQLTIAPGTTPKPELNMDLDSMASRPGDARGSCTARGSFLELTSSSSRSPRPTTAPARGPRPRPSTSSPRSSASGWPRSPRCGGGGRHPTTPTASGARLEQAAIPKLTKQSNFGVEISLPENLRKNYIY